MSIGKLSEANDRLKPLGIRLLARSSKLSVRATLPNKPGTKPGRSQQTIALNLPLTASGINRAEKIAVKIANDRDLGCFRWEDYLKVKEDVGDDVIEQFHERYLATGGKEDTWRSEYGRFYEKLTGLAEKDLLKMVTSTQPNTRNRIRAVTAANALSKFMKTGLTFNEYRGDYSPYESLIERELPTNEAIEAAYELIPNPQWKWVYGMIATYGLRNHEAFRISLRDWPIVLVQKQSKTGYREIFPFPEQWIEKWDLATPRPPPLNLDRDNKALGSAVTHQFYRYGLPFNPYDLRHAWAVRTLEAGLPDSVAADMMGHSVAVHTRIYQRWISRVAKKRIYDRLKKD